MMMNKTLLAVCTYILITGAQACNMAKYTMCTLNFNSEVTAARSDETKICNAWDKVVTCSEDLHCSSLIEGLKASFKISDDIPDGHLCSLSASSIGAQTCNALKYTSCALNFTTDVTSSGYSLKKLCDAKNKLAACSKDAHCSELNEAAMATAFQSIPGGDPCPSNNHLSGAVHVTYSFALVIFMVLLPLTKRI